MSRYSIRQLCFSYSLLALSLVALLSTVSYFVAKRYIHQQNHESYINSLLTKAENISNIITFNRDLVSKLAQQKQLADMIEFSSEEDIQEWAQTMQDLIPENIGLALFNNDGRILGNPVTLRLGDRCVADLSSYLKHQEVGNPPVHLEVKAFEHYDIVEQIYQNDDTSGVIFISFGLDSIHKELDKITADGEHISIQVKNGPLISESNKLTNKAIDFEHTSDIANTNWIIKGSFEQQDLDTLLILISVANIFMFVFVNIVLFAYSRKLFKLFIDDFTAIHSFLMRVKNRDKKPENIKFSGLSETQEIVHNIQYLADDISQLIDFSTTDELTQILNRRGFGNEITRYIQLAHRDVKAAAIIIDVDYFKQANDKFGHLIGDKILKILGDTLSDVTRETDICARLGGDEFSAILLMTNHQNVEQWFERLKEQFKQQQIHKIDELTDISDACGLSAGFTELRNTDKTMEEILRRADVALYTAKSAGRGTIKEDKSC